MKTFDINPAGAYILAIPAGTNNLLVLAKIIKAGGELNQECIGMHVLVDYDKTRRIEVDDMDVDPIMFHAEDVMANVSEVAS